MNYTNLEESLSRNIVVATSIVMGLALIIVFLLLPLFVGAATEYMAMSEQQLSWLASADLAGFCIAATAFVFFARKINWRWTAAGLLLAMIILNFLSVAFEEESNTFLILRFLSGLTQGGLAGIFAAHISDTLLPERNYGIFFAAQTIVSAFFLYLLPPYIAKMESPAPILHAQSSLAILALVMVLLFMPHRGKDRSKTTTTTPSSNILLPLIGVLGLLAFYITQGGTWAYIERIGDSLGHSASFIGKALSISMVGSFSGAMLATAVGLKWGRKLPLVITLIGQLICLWCLFSFGNQTIPFVLSITVFSVLWSYAVPYLFGTLIVVDKSGKTILFSNPIFALGVALAPIILSFFIQGNNYLPVGYLSAIMLIISIGLYLFCINKMPASL